MTSPRRCERFPFSLGEKAGMRASVIPLFFSWKGARPTILKNLLPKELLYLFDDFHEAVHFRF